MIQETFFGLLDGVQPKFSEVRYLLKDEWSPRTVPITTIYEALGELVAEHFETMLDPVRRNIFELIEQAVVEGDALLSTAVCTGLIEAMTTVASKNSDLWSKIRKVMGPQTLHHANAWLNG